MLERRDKMFTFKKDSGLVKVWVSLIMAGTYEFEQVPELFNLRTIVKEVLDEVK